MTELTAVVLEIAALSDAPMLANLLELYIHDLSEAFPGIEPGSDGRFGYSALPLYWTEPERRFPFLIRSESRIVGFVLVTRGSPASDDPTVFDIAEFFVLRAHRRSGIGRRAAHALWNQLVGRWTVRVSERNEGAVRFWTGTVQDYTRGSANVSLRSDKGTVWRVFAFDSNKPTVIATPAQSPP